MAVRMIKKSWWVDFRANHMRYRKRSPENSRTGAQAFEAMLRQKLARGESIEDIEKKAEQEQTFAEFAEKWHAEYVVPNNKHSEQRSKRYVLNSALIPFFGHLPVGKITTYHTEQFKAAWVKKGVSNKTIKNYLTVLNKCLSTAYDWLELKGAPPKIKWPKCNPTSPDFLSADKCEMLLSHANGTVREMILTALRTGMRQGELKGLQFPIDADVYEMLFNRKRGTGRVFVDADEEPFDYHRMERRLTKACKDAGLRKIGWHTLRHTFTSQLLVRGVPITAAQQLLGHANITTTMRYAHLAPSTLREAIDLLNPKSLANADFGQPVGNQWLETQRKEATQKSLVTKNL